MTDPTTELLKRIISAIDSGAFVDKAYVEARTRIVEHDFLSMKYETEITIRLRSNKPIEGIPS